MSSKRQSSRSPSREVKRRKEVPLPRNASHISEDDYFLRMNEFQQWIREEKGKYFDELSGTKTRHYFRKFVKRWNAGELPDQLYQGVAAPVAQTSYKWSFADKVDSKALRSVRDAVVAENWGSGPSYGTTGANSGRTVGPSMPSEADRQLAKESAEELAAMERQSIRRRDRAEQRDRVEDLVGPKETGREGMLEKKRAQRDSDRAARDAKDDGGIEFNDADLMGGGDSFKAMVARRDANKKRFEEKKRLEREAKFSSSASGNRGSEMREKEKATMEMFKTMAKQRFG